jgi:Ankyrin repeats (3 copies)
MVGSFLENQISKNYSVYRFLKRFLQMKCPDHKDWEKVRLWVQECPDMVKEKTWDGHRLLHSACSSNAPIDVIRLLFDQRPGAIKQRGAEGWLPLHYACTHNAPLEVIQWPVEQYPDAVRDSRGQGFLPLQFACRMRRLRLFRFWSKSGRVRSMRGTCGEIFH